MNTILARPKPVRRLLAAVTLAVACILAMASAPTAQANTPSNWSRTISGTHITIGWTDNHAWIIADYADVITQGSGFIAGQLCGIVSDEGLDQACSYAAKTAAAELVKGHARLTDHGLWIAFYVWPAHETAGTW